MVIGYIAGAALAYLIGSIPTSVWVGKWFFRKDVRQHGSGNAGATNTARVLGPWIGLGVLMFDVFKGWFVVYLAHYIVGYLTGSADLLQLQAIMGICAITGHIFPVYEGFRGGKGVATSLGTTLAILPYACIVAFLVFALVFVATRYVSLSSITAAVSFPVFVIAFMQGATMEHILFSTAVAAVIIYTHRSNIKRLIRGEEKRFSLGAPSSAGR